ncbi:hypothetical protein OO013_09830 [Mangrovivirga sp. M17]|uniref:Uncharacterized protein n=1 Tax=Mangrovivirga halotolerans TaxID=2993936 RepID=A0ABT3RRE8_9BACT|nr:hypothetical protein [Mangrovivirga halotolerans]MCX2744166.1 hypothetical protein [Mangrovivirga halotolerans]
MVGIIITRTQHILTETMEPYRDSHQVIPVKHSPRFSHCEKIFCAESTLILSKNYLVGKTGFEPAQP